MTSVEIGFASIAFILFFIYTGMHVALAFCLVSLFGVWAVRGSFEQASKLLALAASDAVSGYDFGVIPLFVLMGMLVSVAELGRDAFVAANAILGRIKGGLGIVELEDDGQEVRQTSEPSNRIALVNSGGHLGGDLYSAIERQYELDTFMSLRDMNAVDTGWSAIVVAVDPMAVDDVISFVRAVRRKSGVPIVLIAEGEGLRAATRTRALRAGPSRSGCEARVQSLSDSTWRTSAS